MRTLSLNRFSVETDSSGESHLGPLVNNPHVLSEIAVLLTTDWAGRPELVVDVVDVPLQVGLQIAAVAALRALEVLHLKDNQCEPDDILRVLLVPDLHVLLVDVMSQVGELSVAVRTGLGLAGALLLHHRLAGHHHGVVIHVIVIVVVVVVVIEKT